MERDINFKNHYTSDAGKVLMRKDDDRIYTNSLWLSANDNIENYKEVIEPKEEASENDNR